MINPLHRRGKDTGHIQPHIDKNAINTKQTVSSLSQKKTLATQEVPLSKNKVKQPVSSLSLLILATQEIPQSKNYIKKLITKSPVIKKLSSVTFISGASVLDLFCYLCFVSAMLSCLFFAAVSSPAGKGLTSCLSCMWCFCVCHFPIWCTGSGVGLDCIDS